MFPRWTALWLAHRYWSARHHGLQALMMWVSIGGIAIGVAAFIIGLSAVNGFEIELQRRVINLIPHAEIERGGGRLWGWRHLAEKVKGQPGVVAVAPYIQRSALLEKGNKFKAVQLRGVDLALEKQVTQLPMQITAAEQTNFFAGGGKVILSQEVAAALQVTPGDWLTAVVPGEGSALRQPKVLRQRLQVASLSTPGSNLQQRLALVPLQDLQSYLGWPPAVVSGLAVKVNDPLKVDLILSDALLSDAIRSIGAPLLFHSWVAQYGHLYQDIQMVRGIIYIALFFVIGVACFNITSTLVIIVRERQRDIAILRTLGASDNFLSQIFVYYGLLVGLSGCLLGASLGLLLASRLTKVVQWLEQKLQWQLLPDQIYFVDFLPSEIRLGEVVGILIAAIVMTLFAGWYPAYRARHSDPCLLLGQE